MDTREPSAPHAHPSTEEQDDYLEAHYSCLERPCASLEGWVFVGYIDELGEEREASYACRRCADSPLRKSGDVTALVGQRRAGHTSLPVTPSIAASKHITARIGMCFNDTLKTVNDV